MMINNLESKVAASQTLAYDSEMLCLTSRKHEFKQASLRAEQAELYVFSEAPDCYGVVNRDSKVNYSINLKTSGGRIYADCDCADFVYRKRLCKHIAAVIDEILFG